MPRSELLFEFYVPHDHSHWKVELHDGGPFGVEACFLKNGELVTSRRFGANPLKTFALNGSARAVAVRWARDHRRQIEHGPLR